MRTLSGNYFYVLLNDAAANPVTVTSTGSISSKTNGTALELAPPADNPNLYWNVANYGQIRGQGGGSSGVSIDNGGRLVNGSSTATGAYVYGGFRGVAIPKGRGGVVNYGTIAASGASSVVVELAMGGQIKNFGLLRGPGALEVEIEGAVGTVVNYGTMTCNGSPGGGVLLAKGGTVVNGSNTVTTALISGGTQSVGVEAEQFATVTNYGSIFGDFSVDFDLGGILVNSGEVSGSDFGARFFNGPGTLVNSGTVGVTGTVRDAVYFGRYSGGGSVTNTASGRIGGGRYGIYAAAAVSVANAGTIASGIGLRAGGTVTNGQSGSTAGLLIGNSDAVSIQGGAGTVVNYGTVSSSSIGGSAIVLFDGGLVKNFGVVQADNAVSLGGAGATLDNHAVVRATSSTGGVAVNLNDGTYLKNNAGGYIGSAYGIGVFAGVGSANVTNAGIIANGIYLANGGSIINGRSGGNGGLISAIEAPALTKILGYQAIGIGHAPGSVANFGTIAAAAGAGVRLKNGGVLQNAQAAAVISGTDLGVGIGGAGTVVNFGTIRASGSAGIGVNLKNSFDHTVTNSGTITGAGGTAIVFGAGSDTLIVENGAKFNGIVIGGPGTNEIDFDKTGKLALAPVYVGFSLVRLGDGAAHSLLVSGAAFAGIAGSPITVYGGAKGDTITAAVPAGDRLVVKGGPGADTFELSLPTLANATVAGGGGADRLTVTNAGSAVLSGLTGVETIALSGAGANTLTLHDQNFSGVTGRTITVLDGNAGDTVAAALPAADTVVLRGGAGNDSFFFTAAGLTAAGKVLGGGGSDRLVLTSGGAVPANGVGGVETYRLFAGAADLLTLAAANFAGVTGNTITVVAGNAGDTVNAAAIGAAHRVVFVGGAGADAFTGGAGADTFEISASNLGGGDRLRGGGGNDRLVLLGSGVIAASGVAGIEMIELSSAAKNTLTLTDANFAGVTGRSITVTAGNAGDTLAAAVPGADKLVLLGGSGGDTFDLSATALAGARITGGQGADRLVLTSAGTVATGNVSGVETYVLANGGADILTLTNANFAGVTGNAITVEGGNAGNRISEAAVAAADVVTIKGGTGGDTLIAGLHAVMTGGSGKDVFEFATPGTTASPDLNSVTDFGHGSDRLALSDAGFRLGLAKASSTLQKLPVALFSTRSNGAFDNAGERFAYDKSTGDLYFDADGNGASHSRQLVATLANHPTLTPGDLFFIA